KSAPARLVPVRACTHCGTPNADDSRFCSSCGTAFDDACPACGATVAVDARFCSSCGTPIASRQQDSGVEERPHERKIVTVVFADVTGSTTLGERLDPEHLSEGTPPYLAALRQEGGAEVG